MPDKKYAGKRFMKSSLSTSLRMYNLLPSTTRRICLSTLRKYKPKSIRLRGKIPFRQSCCEKCENFQNVLDVASKHLRIFPRTIESAVTMSQCDNDDYFPPMKCAFRECQSCGVQKAIDAIRKNNIQVLNNKRKSIMVKQWQTMKETVPGTGKIKTYMHWKWHSLSIKGLLEMFAEQLQPMSRHCFLACWNFHHYIQCKNNLEEGEIAMVIDYAQNYLCKHQNEVQALHWSHAQVTLHPICVSYRCPVRGCNKLVLHEVVHVSDDLKHDAHLVKKMIDGTFPVLEKRHVPIRKIVEWSDQAPSQYKNKSAFRYLSQSKIPTIRNFFGVRHGKGPCDACTGRVKQSVTALVKSGEVAVNSAQTFYQAAKEHLEKPWPGSNECRHYMLNFVFTPKLISRPNTATWKGVKESRDELHSIMNRNDFLKVNVRNIICMCSKCLHGESDGECEYKDYTDNWCGFDMAKFRPTETDFQFWGNIPIRKIGGSRIEFDWQEKLDTLNSFNTYGELSEHVEHNPIPILQCRISDEMRPADDALVDAVSLYYRPTDCPSNYTPCTIVGDGNCFPRSLSFLCFRSEENHVEMRVRLIYEAIVNANIYLNNRHLSKGAQIVYRRGSPCATIALYSPGYRNDAARDIVGCYQHDVMEVVRPGAYCGLWQIAQAANILRHPIVSVFPQRNHRFVQRLDFNRTFFCTNEQYNSRRPLRIMWTCMRINANHAPNPLCPYVAQCK